jgi:hypothetical protein
MSLSPATRVVLSISVPLVTVAGLAVVGPALAASSAAGSPRTTAVPAIRAMIAPLPGLGPRTSAQVGAAARTCVQYAARAGWANNGYFGGDLVTAAAICVAESAGNPALIVCDPGGQKGNYPGFSCPGGTTSEDRGLWQLNNNSAIVPNPASDQCAFNPVCNADYAYSGAKSNHGSLRGLDFAPWASYDQGIYTQFIDPVQAVVTNLRMGTVTSALLGECLVPVKSAVNSKVVIANCGDGSPLQLWSVRGGKLRSGSSCAAIGLAGRTPGVVLRPCGPGKLQQWVPVGRNELRNAADGKCLTDPNASLSAGTQVDVTACANAKDQTWWLP